MADKKQDTAHQPNKTTDNSPASAPAPAVPERKTYSVKPVTSVRQPVKSNPMLTFRVEGDVMPNVGDAVRLKWLDKTFVGSVYEIINGDVIRLNQLK